MLRFVIIGCGLIGQKRANALAQLTPDAKLVACADLDFNRAEKLSNQFSNCIAFSDYKKMLDQVAMDAVVVATTHDVLSVIAKQVMLSGKHVLLEKPAGRNAAEIENIINTLKDQNIVVHVGFNHRYHPAMQEAKKLIEKGCVGDLMYVRARYGHGGRVGYENEWRANPVLSGGGELIDQGVHLIDLSRWFLGEFSEVDGFCHTYFWNMSVEDNAFLILKTKDKQSAFLHASCTEWKNLFSFEIFGKTGKLHINGLGGSYGPETLTYYKMKPEMGVPDIKTYEYPQEDHSWKAELSDFIDQIKNNRAASVTLQDAFEGLTIVEKIYQKSGIHNAR